MRHGGEDLKPTVGTANADLLVNSLIVARDHSVATTSVLELVDARTTVFVRGLFWPLRVRALVRSKAMLNHLISTVVAANW
jgi:hypothetical protein